MKRAWVVMGDITLPSSWAWTRQTNCSNSHYSQFGCGHSKWKKLYRNWC